MLTNTGAWKCKLEEFLRVCLWLAENSIYGKSNCIISLWIVIYIANAKCKKRCAIKRWINFSKKQNVVTISHEDDYILVTDWRGCQYNVLQHKQNKMIVEVEKEKNYFITCITPLSKACNILVIWLSSPKNETSEQKNSQQILSIIKIKTAFFQMNFLLELYETKTSEAFIYFI